MTPVRRFFVLLLMTASLTACAPREDPGRVALRARLKQQATLKPEDLALVLDEVNRAIEGKSVRIRQNGVARNLEGDERDVVLGMLTYRAGVFDEGLRTDQGPGVRIINAPGRSSNAEIEASRRLLIDVETFVPRRFEFSYAFPGLGDYAYDLEVDR
jgi:hypothetical protein